MNRYIRVLFSILILSGCATTTEVYKYTTESIYPPVRVHINRTVPVPRFYVNRLDEVNAEIKRSGMFVDAGSHVDSPLVFDITLHRGTTDTAANTAGHLLSAATLFVVPSKVNNFNKLTVDLYLSGKKIKTYEYTDHYEETLSITTAMSSEVSTNEFSSIRKVVNMFLEEFDKDKVLKRKQGGKSGEVAI